MREAHRIKEKYELSIDNRQIVSFFIAGIVVIGTVFVLGVVVGKKLAGNHAASNAADLLSALDEKAAAMEQAKPEPEKAEPRLTFQDELTKKTPSERPSESASPRASSTEAKVLPAPESLPPPPEAAKADPPSHERLKQAIAHAEKVPSETPPAVGSFTLQLSASQARDDADRFAAKLRSRGYEPYVIESDVKGRGRWYRVRMGRFASREAAAKYLSDFRRETQLEAFVTSAN